MEYLRTINGLTFPCRFSDRSVEDLFLPLLRGLTAMEQRLGRRILVLLAAPPGTGKSTLADLLQMLSETREGLTPITCLGMDGFHHYQEYLLSHFIEIGGEMKPLATVKGSPPSFDLERLRQRMKQVKTQPSCPWPVYDRKLHDPVEGAVEVTGSIVLIEGNYFLLQQPGWDALPPLADFTIRISAREEDVRDRIVTRRLLSGTPRKEAEEFVDRSDMANVRLCIAQSGPADLELRLMPDGEYVFSGGRFPE